MLSCDLSQLMSLDQDFGALAEAWKDLDDAWDCEKIQTIHIGGWLKLLQGPNATYFTPINPENDSDGGSLCLIRPDPENVTKITNLVSSLIRLTYHLQNRTNTMDCLSDVQNGPFL